MAIYETAYDTTACGGYQFAKIKESLQRAWLLGGLSARTTDVESMGSPIELAEIVGGNSTVDAIAYFGHPVPILMPEETEHGKQTRQLMCVDLRHFGRFDMHQHKFIVRNHPEHDWAIDRAILTKMWIDGRIEALRDLSTVPAATYMSLIAECISRRFQLDPSEKMDVTVLAGMFYYSMFTDADVFDEQSRSRIGGNIARITRIPTEKVFKFVNNDAIPVMNDIEFLCDSIKAFVPNHALQNLNKGTLTAVIGGTWYGTNSREIVTAGLEHMPTWLMIVYAALSQATYKKSALFKVAEQHGARGAGESYTRSMSLLLGRSRNPF